MTKFTNKEIKRLNLRTDWYFKEHKASFNNQLTGYWYQSIKPHLKGPIGLEMGPAEGIMTSALTADFKKLYVLDAIQKFIDHAEKLSPKIKGLVGLFENFETDLKFDTIIMSHVLEHVDEPVLILKRASKWLSENGKIIVVVPHANSLHRLIGVEMGLIKKTTDLNEADHKIGHRRVYTKEALKKDIKDAGLKTETLGGIFLKPLSNSQLMKIGNQKLFDALYKLGDYFQENSCELYAVIR